VTTGAASKNAKRALTRTASLHGEEKPVHEMKVAKVIGGKLPLAAVRGKGLVPKRRQHLPCIAKKQVQRKLQPHERRHELKEKMRHSTLVLHESKRRRGSEPTSFTDATDSRSHCRNTTRPQPLAPMRRAASSPARAVRHARITVAPALCKDCAMAYLAGSLHTCALMVSALRSAEQVTRDV
jgi:hypothetical protein